MLRSRCRRVVTLPLHCTVCVPPAGSRRDDDLQPKRGISPRMAGMCWISWHPMCYRLTAMLAAILAGDA